VAGGGGPLLVISTTREVIVQTTSSQNGGAAGNQDPFSRGGPQRALQGPWLDERVLSDAVRVATAVYADPEVRTKVPRQLMQLIIQKLVSLCLSCTELLTIR
jgi:hypothetical protein